MKFDISIKDATFEEVQDIIAKIAGENWIASVSPAPEDDDDGEVSANDVTGKLDSEGLPWDERIHSSNKKTTAKGVWVKRRGVDQQTYDAVVAELKNPAPAVQELPAAQPQLLQQTPQYIPTPAPAPVPEQRNIGDLFTKVQQLFQTGQADNIYLQSLTQRLSQQFQVQVNTINDISGRQDMIDAAFALIASDGK